MKEYKVKFIQLIILSILAIGLGVGFGIVYLNYPLVQIIVSYTVAFTVMFIIYKLSKNQSGGTKWFTKIKIYWLRE